MLHQHMFHYQVSHRDENFNVWRCCRILCLSVLVKHFLPYFSLMTTLLLSQFRTKLSVTFATSHFASNNF